MTLFDYTFFLKELETDFFDHTEQPESKFIIPLNEKIIGKKPHSFQLLLHSTNHFCFYIPPELLRYDDKFIKEEVIENIVRFLFLPNYIRLNGKYVFFMERKKEENKTLELIKNEFQTELKKQGINEIVIEMIQTKPTFESTPDKRSISLVHHGLNDYLNNGIDDGHLDTLIKEFVFPPCFNKKWIVPVESYANFKKKNKLIEKFENRVRNDYPFCSHLIKMYQHASRDISALQSENKILKFKLENSAYSLQLIRQEYFNHSDEYLKWKNSVQQLADTDSLLSELKNEVAREHNRAEDILAWYQKEYELLPTWYKRFGHVIKFFTGKRSFKSLFK
jgi:hypothetical protein